jgi:LacI family transcriptional regulator
MPAPKVITLKDIAEQAGVSIMTVSRVMRKQRNISSQTQNKVLQIARQLGYRPNPLVAALMSYRRAANPVRSFSTIGYITNYPIRDEWRKSTLLCDFFEGAAESADRHGYQLEEFWLREPGMTAGRLSKILYNRNVPGLVIAPLPVSHGHLRLNWDHFSAVSFGYSLAWPQLHRAVNHQFRSLRLAMRQLRKYGYRRMGMAMSASYDSRVDYQWSGSFLTEQGKTDPADRVPLHVVEDEHWTEKKFADWFQRSSPDVIVGQQTEIIDWLKNLGLKVPEDVAFVHLNLPDASGEVAGIYQNGKTIGEVAVDFLVGMMHRNERGVPDLAHSILVEGTWIDGKTVRNLSDDRPRNK